MTATAGILTGVSEVPEAAWDALACPEAGDGGRPLDPFTTHRFLAALESSGSVGRGTGWQACPLTLTDCSGHLVGALPLYLKSHSQGEYIFDHGWAEAYVRTGGRYYPKAQVAVPFTPVPGRRLLAAPGQRQALLDAAIDLTQANDLSSLHLTFCTAEEAGALAGHRGTLHRMSEQYHWENPGYASFDDFLAALSSRKRKMIRKERAVAHGHGLRIEAMTGDDLRPEHWDALWSFYQDTGSRKWGRPYLTRGFFDLLHHEMRQDVLLVLAFDGARAVAGALNLIGREALFGRYWGTLGDYPCLHFELCYYQAMDWAIAARLSRVEAGAQGEHKLARGYMPVTIHSLHWIKDQGFREAVARYLEAERREVGQEIAALAGLGPFRKGPGGG